MRMEKPQASCPASRRTLRPFVDFVQIECGKQPFFGKVAVRRKVPHRASEKAKKHPCQGAFFCFGGSGEIREEERNDDDLAIFRGVGDAAPRKERHAKECRSSPLMLWKRRCVRHK